ncbi:MAG TPA: ATP-binding protein [Acidimicrobiales bacterium]|nr:ATP-binding protein [Acidimicrobiales bacterium]
MFRRPTRAGEGLAVDEIDRLRRAELALAAAPSIEAAAHELGKHAMALLDAPAAIVIIEGVGDTVRMEAGDTRGHSVYETGSRMRLLDDDGTPCGSIAVAARSGRPYGERDERILDALGERVSSTLHRLSLFEAVRAEQRTLADVLSSTSDGIFSVGPDQRVRSWNQAMARITGTAEVVAAGQHCCAVFRPCDEKGVPLFGVTCPIRTGDEAELLVQIEAGRGGPIWLNCAFSRMSDGGFVVIARDVTTRKQIEDEKADFLATVSHELRTPLTPIKGFLQTLTRRDAEFTQDERAHIYEVMLREEQRLERLVHQLLLATSLDSAESFVIKEEVDWEMTVRAQVDQIARHDPMHEYSVALAPDLPKVMADEQLAGQVLGNLLSNAAKYSPEGTVIGVGVAHDGHRIVTTVVDRGPGVPMADRDRIFDRFTRLGDHLTRPEQGVGLGLFIVRRSVETMGGTVWVEDAPAGGAAFSFSLPAVRARARRPIRIR